MNNGLALTTALTALGILTASCSLSAGTAKWEKLSFNGRDFQRDGREKQPSLWLRDGYTPRTEEPHGGSADYGKLPPKAGAVAGLCYLQASGGRIADQSGAIPLPDEQITIRSSQSGISVTRSDAAGIFIEELLPGNYQLYCRGIGVEVRVKEGQTVLVPILGAKRMAD